MIKEQFTGTLLIASLPYLMITAEVRDWIAIAVGIASFFWIVIQIVWRLKNWNEDK